MNTHTRKTRQRVEDRSLARTFAEIQPGETFFRKAGRVIWTMVKANESQAVMAEDAPRSMRGEPTPFWDVHAMELMVPTKRVEEIRKSEPELIKTSSLELTP